MRKTLNIYAKGHMAKKLYGTFDWYAQRGVFTHPLMKRARGINMKKRRMTAFFLGVSMCLAAVPASPVSADYRYNQFDEPVPAQSVYVAEASYNGKGLGVGSFNAPSDLYVYDNSLIYILDSGNNRIVVLDDSFQVSRVLEDISVQGEMLDITGARGIYVSPAGDIYLSDLKNNRVLVLDGQGRYQKEITRPDSVLLTDNITFAPRNVVMDTVGTLYMISENSTQGAYMIDSNGEFLGFYGRNKVDVTASVVFQALMRELASEAQRAKMSSFVPVEFSNFDIDEEGFIYTVTAYSDAPKDSAMIRKLNPLGENILLSYRDWGDEPDGGKYITSYVDVAVDDNRFIYALDGNTGRIFMYDNTGFQVAIFGGSGSVRGTFRSATAVDTIGNRVVVLDSTKNNVTVFQQTYFGEQIAEGLSLYNQGMLEESLAYFQEITTMDANFFYAYYAMAEIYYDQGEYGLSEEYAKLSGVATEIYSQSKKILRNDWLRNHFAGVFFTVILAALLVLGSARVRDAKRKDKMLLALKERRSDL